MVLHILRAEAEDYNDLTDICYKIKRHWGYPEYLLELWKDDMTITPRYIRNHDLLKIINGEGQIMGFGSIGQNGREDLFEINHFWILPDFYELNIGRLLLERLEAKAPRKSIIKIVADPNIRKFYQENGYQKVGESKSKPDGMLLPVMKKVIN